MITIETQLKLENHFQTDETHETLKVQVKDNRFLKAWTKATLSLCRQQFIIDIVDGSQLIVDFKLINSIFDSKNRKSFDIY